MGERIQEEDRHFLEIQNEQSTQASVAGHMSDTSIHLTPTYSV